MKTLFGNFDEGNFDEYDIEIKQLPMKSSVEVYTVYNCHLLQSWELKIFCKSDLSKLQYILVKPNIKEICWVTETVPL